MARAWQELCKSIARAWQDHGKSMARAWQDHGKNMANAGQEGLFLNSCGPSRSMSTLRKNKLSLESSFRRAKARKGKLCLRFFQSERNVHCSPHCTPILHKRCHPTSSRSGWSSSGLPTCTASDYHIQLQHIAIILQPTNQNPKKRGEEKRRAGAHSSAPKTKQNQPVEHTGVSKTIVYREM